MATRGRTLEVGVDEEAGLPAVDGGIESPSGKLVYLYLQVSDGATIDELKRALDMSALSLHPILRTLGEKDLVERSAGQFVVSR